MEIYLIYFIDSIIKIYDNKQAVFDFLKSKNYEYSYRTLLRKLEESNFNFEFNEYRVEKNLVESKFQ